MSLEGLKPEFRERIEALLKEAGPRCRLNYGYRSYEQQKYLYDSWVAGKPGFFPANRPGTSKHEIGEAADVAHKWYDPETKRWFGALMAKYGFYAPHSKEPWHLELARNRKPLPLTVPEKSQANQPGGKSTMAHFADQIVWDDGTKTKVYPDGSVKGHGDETFYGSMFDVADTYKLSFVEAEGIIAHDPTDKTKGYRIYDESGDGFDFPLEDKFKK